MENKERRTQREEEMKERGTRLKRLEEGTRAKERACAVQRVRRRGEGGVEV